MLRTDRLLGMSFLFLIVAGGGKDPSPAVAGKLEEFERSAIEERGHPDKSSSSRSNAERSGSSSCFDPVVSDVGDEVVSETAVPAASGCISGLFGAIGRGGANSMKRIDPLEARSGERVIPRKDGEALISFLRVDLSYQEVESDVSAGDLRAELGYGSIGFQLRRTVYEERDPPDTLEAFQYHILYRMSYGTAVEVDLGVGSLFLTGKEKNSGFSVTVPFLYHPVESVGLEFRPAWSAIHENSIYDLDLGVLFGGRYASLRAGYRWFRGGHESLDGPYAGVALRW